MPVFCWAVNRRLLDLQISKWDVHSSSSGEDQYGGSLPLSLSGFVRFSEKTISKADSNGQSRAQDDDEEGQENREGLLVCGVGTDMNGDWNVPAHYLDQAIARHRNR